MEKNKCETQDRIIKNTISLIKEHGDIGKITIRDIASRSEVGVGLINYHFQTKENLINLCILRLINQFIEEVKEVYQRLDLNPIDKLKHAFKIKSDFLAENPGISKISMMLDLDSSDVDDNTDQASKLHFKVLKEWFGNEKTDEELFVKLHILMSSIQVAFLRNKVFRKNTEIDFFQKEERDRLIDMLIDDVIGS